MSYQIVVLVMHWVKDQRWLRGW